MPCYHPVPAWRSRTLSSKRTLGVTFKFSEGFKDLTVDLKCGTCIGCILDRAAMWETRAKNEALDHEQNSFVTLTYTDKNLPDLISLKKRDIQLFLKRLRKYLEPRTIKYLFAGEYGPRTHRPHYHGLIFGWLPDDLMPLRGKGARHPLYTSKILETIWGHGFVSVAPFEPETAGYVTRYTISKIDTSRPSAKRPDSDWAPLEPPFQLMSQGLGANYARTNAAYLAHHNGVRQRGGKLTPLPRYYQDIINRERPDLAVTLRRRQLRQAWLASNDENNTGSRLITRETVRKARINNLKRDQQ